MSMATSWVWRRSNICNTLCYWKWDFPSWIEKASIDNKTVSKLFIIFFPRSCLVLLMPEAASFSLPSFFSLPPVYLVFSPVPSFNLFSIWYFCLLVREQVKGRKMITFAHSLVKLGVQLPAHKQARTQTHRDDGWKVSRQGCKHDSWLLCGY